MSQALNLDGNNALDEESFYKVLKTCAAIANIGKGKKVYVLIGIVESAQTAARIESLFGMSCLTHDRFKISGIEHEARTLGKSLDQFFQMIVDKITQSKISEPLRSYITSNIKAVRYYDQDRLRFGDHRLTTAKSVRRKILRALWRTAQGSSTTGLSRFDKYNA